MIEVLKQALEALEKSLPRLAPYGEQDWLDCKAAITSLRKAIQEEALRNVQRLGQEIEQEPDKYEMDIECTKCGAKQSGVLTVYTHQPQRTWVGLTDDQIYEMYNEPRSDAEMLEFARAIETKLKQKNGYAEEKNT